MKIFRSIIIMGGFLFGIIAILTFIFSKIYLTPETIKASLIFEIEKRLRREVSFNDIQVDLLKGITLKGVTIHKSLPREKQNFLYCEEVHLQFRFVPVLIKKLLINKISIKNPRVDLQVAESQPFSLYGNTVPRNDSNNLLEIIYLPDSINLKDGIITFEDLSNNFSFALENFQVSSDDISMLFPFDFTIAANLQGSKRANVYCKGRFSVPNKKLTADITTGEIPLTAFKEYFKTYNIPIQNGLFKLESNLKTDGSASIVFNGNCIFKDVSLAINNSASPDNPLILDALNTTFNFQSIFDTSKNIFTLKDLNGKFLFSQFKARGSIKKRGNTRFINFTLNSKKFYVDDLLNKIRSTHSSFIKDLKLSGDIGLKIDIKGKLDKAISPSLLVNLRGNRLLYPPLGSLRPKLHGDLRIKQDSVSLSRLKIETDNISITLAGDISGFRYWPPKSRLKIVTSYINLYGLFSPSESESWDEIGPFDLAGLTFDIPINFPSTPFFGATLSNIRGNYILENNKFFIKDLQGNIDEGSFNLSATVDLGVKGLDYYTYLKLNDVPFKSIMSMFQTNYSKYIDGTCNVTCAISGQGTEPGSFADNLKGDAFLYLSDGNIKGLTFMPQFSYFINSEDLEKISFQKAQIQLKLRNGRINLDGALINPKIELHPSGEVGLDSTLELEAKLKISPELFTGSTRIADYLPHEDGWIMLPVNIDGTLMNPRLSLSKETMSFILKETLPRLLMDIISGVKNGSEEEIMEYGAEAEDNSTEEVLKYETGLEEEIKQML